MVEKMQEVGVTAISGETIIKNGKAKIISTMSPYGRSTLSNYGFTTLKHNMVVEGI